MNTPNKITLSRILLIPFIIFFYLATFIPYGKLIAALIFTVACLTDFVDGKIARKTNQVTTLGKFFDTIADKVLIMTGMILVVAFPVAGSEAIMKPLWLGIVCVIIMLAREFIVSALRQIAAASGLVLAADKGGKIKALFQDVTITLYMFYAFFVVEIYPLILNTNTAKTINAVFGIFLMIMLIVSALLTLWSGASYLIRNKKVFKDVSASQTSQSVASDEVLDTDNQLDSNASAKTSTEVTSLESEVVSTNKKKQSTAQRGTTKKETSGSKSSEKVVANKSKVQKSATSSKKKKTAADAKETTNS